MTGDPRDLRSEHSAARIHARLQNPKGESALGDFMLGGVDGVVTTFAIIAGSAGGQLGATTVIVLGIANLLADGFSMAVSNYLGTQARREEIRKTRADEEWQIDTFPAGERREIREIFARKGFAGSTLERIVDVITSDKKVWVDTMMAEELKLSEGSARPARAGLTTFGAFVICGLTPLLPFLLAIGSFDRMFGLSAILGMATFLVLGVSNGLLAGSSPAKSGLRTLLIGGTAAALAYGAGSILHSVFGG